MTRIAHHLRRYLVGGAVIASIGATAILISYCVTMTIHAQGLPGDPNNRMALPFMFCFKWQGQDYCPTGTVVFPIVYQGPKIYASKQCIADSPPRTGAQHGSYTYPNVGNWFIVVEVHLDRQTMIDAKDYWTSGPAIYPYTDWTGTVTAWGTGMEQ